MQHCGPCLQLHLHCCSTAAPHCCRLPRAQPRRAQVCCPAAGWCTGAGAAQGGAAARLAAGRLPLADASLRPRSPAVRCRRPCEPDAPRWGWSDGWTGIGFALSTLLLLGLGLVLVTLSGLLYSTTGPTQPGVIFNLQPPLELASSIKNPWRGSMAPAAVGEAQAPP